jgi:hypothetical protein
MHEYDRAWRAIERINDPQSYVSDSDRMTAAMDALLQYTAYLERRISQLASLVGAEESMEAYDE